MKLHAGLIWVMGMLLGCCSIAQADVLATYPQLKKFLNSEPSTAFRLGFGIVPVQIMRNSAGMGFSIFQLHWSSGSLDWEVFNATFGMTPSGDPNSNVNVFTFRSAPKLKLSDVFSFGPLVGTQFVSFPSVSSKIYKNNLFTPVFEPFSSSGLIYGAVLSEIFNLSQFQLRANQTIYWQTYSTTATQNGWKYYFQNNSLNADSKPIQPGPVVSIEISLAY